MAAARRTRPASWPPMRRVFSGSVLPAEVARTLVLWCAAAWPDAAALAGDGVTVGNRPAGSDEPAIGAGSGGSGGSAGGGGRPLPSPGGGSDGVGVGAATTATSPAAVNGLASLALAVAVSVRFLPVAAIFQTAIRAWSSSAWFFGSVPSLQRVPEASGQTEKLGALVRLILLSPVDRLTVTFFASAPVVHTQTM